MGRPLKCFARRVLLTAGACLPLHVAATAETLEDLVGQTKAAMERGEFPQALDWSERAISEFGGSGPLQAYGPQFGSVYYRKGVCEMKLKRWQDAMQSFEICYRDFPNAETRRDNPCHTLALLKWGEAAMGAEEWALAIGKFAKFSDERDREADVFARGSFHINAAVCRYKLGNIAAGNEDFEIALGNRLDFPTPDPAIMAGFQALVEAAVAKRDERALVEFIAKNRGELTVETAELARCAGAVLRLAGEALAAGMRGAAIALYQFVPSEGAPGIVKLAAMALIHERSGNPRGALAAYRQLVDDFPGAADREKYFYHVVRVAVATGKTEIARRHAAGFLKEFPASPHAAEIRAAIGTGLSVSGKFPPARQLGPVGPEPAPLPPSRDFAVALDLYQCRKYLDAKAAFAAIQATAAGSPQSDTRIFAAFYEAECLRQLEDWQGLSGALKNLPKKPSLGASRLKQLEIDDLWVTISAKDWRGADARARELGQESLPGGQRAQVACCRGIALENLRRPEEALDAYNVAMTADAGASEGAARRAALGALRILSADAEVQVAITRAGVAGAGRTGPGFAKLDEAAAVARLFDLYLGAGAKLPAEYLDLVKYGAPPSGEN